MSTPILLLTGPEEAPFLEAKLRAVGKNITVDFAHSKAMLQQASQRSLFQEAPYSRLIAFCTNVVVPEDVLRIFQGGCYNFHPGSPEYPGSNAASFAIYDQVERYGVTAHEMEASVDSGAIVGVERFAVPSDCRFMDLEILAYQNLLTLFDKLSPQLVKTSLPLPQLPIRWGVHKKTQKDFDHMKTVTADMDEDEIRLRWRAFG